MQTPILILGGILLGVFTPTEAAAVAVFYAVIVAFFVLKTMKLSDLPDVLSRSAMTSAVVLLLVGAAMAFKTVVSLSYAPQILAEFILSLSENPLILLFLINILLFIVGMFLDAGPAIIILGPILGPIFVEMGVHPVHFAIIMSVNLTVGLATPPMGLVLFVASSVAGEKVETIAKAILPFLAVEILVIFLITYVPAISMTIPRLDRVRELTKKATGRNLMLKGLTTAALAATMLAGSAMMASAQDFTIRATANSNENDEDYDGLVVFKNFVEQASNGAIAVEMFIGTQLCSNGAECLQGIADGNIDVYISTSGGVSGIFPFVQVLDLPYLMADDRVAEAALSERHRVHEHHEVDDDGSLGRRRSPDDRRQHRRLEKLCQHQAPDCLAFGHGRPEDPHRGRRPAAGTGEGPRRRPHADPVAGTLHFVPDRRCRRLEERHHRHHGHEVPRCRPAIRDA